MTDQHFYSQIDPWTGPPLLGLSYRQQFRIVICYVQKFMFNIIEDIDKLLQPINGGISPVQSFLNCFSCLYYAISNHIYYLYNQYSFQISMQIKVVQNQNQIYQKDKLLGEGAFGKAYLVKHKLTGESLVIKQMNIQHMSTKEREETIKEAQILRNLSHPNIINFREVYITKNNKLKIVMQYAQCGDIAKAIALQKSKKQLFPEAQILAWFTQICLAIKHVHDRKILHRDIKGQNIFVAKNNSLKLGDFGIARVLNMTHDKARTVVGTPYYLSPQIIENKPYSFKSDIWSIGAVLYELCCLQPPFTANSLQMLALKIVKGSYPPIQGNYSKELKSLVSQILVLDPNKRPSIHQILQKDVIKGRIAEFLTQTKRISEFSHTILHNQKVEIFANKLVQIQKQRSQSKGNEKNYESERQKLKEEQARMQAALIKKKEDDKKKQQQKRLDQIRRKEEQARRKEEERKKRLIYEEQKKQQMQREYQENLRKAELMRARKAEEDRQYQRQMQYAKMARQKQQYEERKRREMQMARKVNKKIEEDKKMQQFNDFAKRQYYENLEIRRRAQERARRQQQSYYDIPPRDPEVGVEKNYHYAQQNRPKTKQQSRINSSEKRPNNSQFYPAKKKEAEPTQQQLINAFCNPNYKKGSVKKQNEVVQPQKRISVSDIREQPKKQAPLNSKADQEREKIRKDRENYYKNKQKVTEYKSTKQTEPEPQQISKWNKKKSAEKKNQSPSRLDSPRFNSIEENKKSPSKLVSQQEQKQFDSLIRGSENLFLEVNNPVQFQKYVDQLQQILQGVHQRIQMLPQIPLAQEIVFRDDDQFQLSLTVEPVKKKEQIETQQTDLDYFSNYSKLQTLRIQLEEAFGLQNFIRLYRHIEKQVAQRGLEGFDIDEALDEIGGNIDRVKVNKNKFLLLTLVALEDKMVFT